MLEGWREALRLGHGVRQGSDTACRAGVVDKAIYRLGGEAAGLALLCGGRRKALRPQSRPQARSRKNA